MKLYAVESYTPESVTTRLLTESKELAEAVVAFNNDKSNIELMGQTFGVHPLWVRNTLWGDLEEVYITERKTMDAEKGFSLLKEPIFPGITWDEYEQLSEDEIDNIRKASREYRQGVYRE